MIDTASRESSANRSLERALSLLLVLEDAGQSMGLTDLSRATQLAKPTVRRLMSVLEKYGFAERWQGRFHLGITVLPLAHAYLMGKELMRVTFPVLQELAQTSEETASLFVRSGFYRVVVQRVDGRFPLRYVLPIGQKLPLHLGSGKILASSMPDEELQQMLDKVGEMKLATGERVTRKAFLDELEQIRRQGYVISRNERTMGAASVGAPVLDANGKTIAVVVVAGPTDRMTMRKLKHLSIEVRNAANAISDRYNGG
jgi:DNA-binding IclR family transcriptional regulator